MVRHHDGTKDNGPGTNNKKEKEKYIMMTGIKQVADAVTGFFWLSGCGPDSELEKDKVTDDGQPAGDPRDAGTPIPAKDAGHAKDAGTSFDAGVRDAENPDTGKDGGLKPDENEVVRYSPPDGGRSATDFPAPDSQGVSYFSLMEEGSPTTGTFPISLNCNPAQASCYFGMGVKGYSFASNNLAASAEQAISMEADFSPDIDGQSSF
ncbi:MAG: hypothetical protein U1D33_02300, partial [bacterium]|nr:hypothetical protein [bacterium]